MYLGSLVDRQSSYYERRLVTAALADVFIHTCARAALAGNAELCKLSSAKMFDAINKAHK